MDFVKHLFGHGCGCHHTACLGRLGDDNVASGADLANRKAKLVHPRHILKARITEIAASDLTAAFKKMASKRASGKQVKFIFTPAKFMD